MTKSQWKLIVAINLVIVVIVLSPFLPGPSSLSNVTNGFFSLIQFLSLFGLFLIPIGVIWTIRQENRKERNDKKSFPIILWTVPSLAFIFSFWGANIARDFSRNFAISRASKIITAIEQFRRDNNNYPNNLNDLTPKYLKNVPKPWIMGISEFGYGKKADSYNLGFSQNVLVGFNFEVVEYNPRDHHQADGELQELYDTGKKHWRYYVYD